MTDPTTRAAKIEAALCKIRDEFTTDSSHNAPYWWKEVDAVLRLPPDPQPAMPVEEVLRWLRALTDPANEDPALGEWVDGHNAAMAHMRDAIDRAAAKAQPEQRGPSPWAPQDDDTDPQRTCPYTHNAKVGFCNKCGWTPSTTAKAQEQAPQVDRGELRDFLVDILDELAGWSSEKIADRILALLPAQAPAQGDETEARIALAETRCANAMREVEILTRERGEALRRLREWGVGMRKGNDNAQDTPYARGFGSSVDQFIAEIDRLFAEGPAQGDEKMVKPVALRPYSEWDFDEDGAVLWYRTPIEEPPYVGWAGDSDWPFAEDKTETLMWLPLPEVSYETVAEGKTDDWGDAEHKEPTITADFDTPQLKAMRLARRQIESLVCTTPGEVAIRASVLEIFARMARGYQ